MVAVALLGATWPAAASLRTTSDEELARSSVGAVRGRVVATASAWDADAGAIYTYVTIDVARAWGLAGAPARVVLKQLGGVVGREALVVGGQAHFTAGEDVMVLLDVRPRDRTLAVAGLAHGKWTLATPPGAEAEARPARATMTTARRRREVETGARIADEYSVAALDALAALAGTRAQASDARVVASLTGFHAAPALATATATAATIAARWHEADSGTPVFVDVAAGGHSRFPAGGAVQITNALGAWSGGGALRLADGIARSPRCFGNAEPPDGRISVAFDDPCDEIADTSPTLAIGGAYFSAADIRAVNGVPYWKLTKGMVVTDNAPAKFAGMSMGCFEELLTHELGHAIGLAHATVAPAVMFPTLSPLCAGRATSMPLAPPDLAVLQTTYPGVGLGVAPPTPTGFLASVVQSTVTLQWDASQDAAQDAAPGGSLELEVGSYSGGRDLAVTAVPPSGLVVPHVWPGVYHVRLVARNGAGASAPTPDVVISVAPVPRDVPRNAVGTAVGLVWQPAPAALGPVSYLVVAGHAPGVVEYEVPVASTSIFAPSVGSGRYYVRVVALNQSGLTPLTPEMIVDVPPR